MIQIMVKIQSGFPDGTADTPHWQVFEIQDAALEAYLRVSEDRQVVGARVSAAAKEPLT